MNSKLKVLPKSVLGQHGLYEKRGRTGVLLIHGITGAPTEMKSLIRKLASQGFTVACPQLAGHCLTLREMKQSHWQDWYATAVASLQFLAAECDTVMVSGLSMGALLALKLAADYPDKVAGVAALSTTFFYDGWNIPHFRQRWLLPLVIYSPLRYFLSYHEPEPYGIKDDRIRRLIATVYEGNSANRPEIYGYSEFPGVTIRETFGLIRAVRKSLSRVDAPLLVVHSTEDDMASLENAELLIAAVSSKRIEPCYLDDTYHVLTLDKRRDEVAEKVASFFFSCVNTEHRSRDLLSGQG